MILNTRNFLLYLLAVAFLVIAIAFTVSTRSGDVESSGEYNFSPSPTEISNEASVIGAVTTDREERLALMREMVGENIGAAKAADQFNQDEEALLSTTVDESTESVRVVEGEMRCEEYAQFTDEWNPNGLAFKVVEGARLLVRGVEGVEVPVWQLPLRSYALPIKSCLQTDVVAVALEGSLIRNHEVGLYSIFTEETLLGYTIDGFPLRGVTTRPTDECGGAVVDGQYQYYLKADSSQILNCFAGVPIDLSDKSSAIF